MLEGVACTIPIPLFSSGLSLGVLLLGRLPGPMSRCPFFELLWQIVMTILPHFPNYILIVIEKQWMSIFNLYNLISFNT